jgi:hypothetical protein
MSPLFHLNSGLREQRKGVLELLAYEPRFDINPAGEIVLPATYRYAHDFSDGLAAVNTGTGEAHDSVAAACENKPSLRCNS